MHFRPNQSDKCAPIKKDWGSLCLPSWPLLSRTFFVCSRARRTGGWGMTTPSHFMIPIASLRSKAPSSLHGTGTDVTSYLWFGCEFITRVNNSRSCREWQTGPQESLIVRLPPFVLCIPPLGIRSEVGRMPYSPLKAAGTRIDPPMSVEGAIGLPLIATNTESPPELPPAPRFLLYGFVVRPQRLLTVSKAIPDWGIVVLQKKIAPALRRVSIRVESCLAMLSFLAT